MRQKTHLLAAMVLLGITIIWGAGFSATQLAMDAGAPVLWILMVRFLIGTAFLFCVFHRRILRTGFRTVLRGCGAGAMLIAAFCFQTLGQARSSVSTTSFLTSTYVVMLPFFQWLFTGQRPKTRVFLLCIMTLLGVLMISAGEGFSIRMGAGEWIVLACAVLYGLHIVYLGTVCRKDDPVQTAFWQLLAAGIGCALLIVSGGVEISSEAIRGMLMPCLFLGILSTGVCYLGQSWGQTRMPPAQASVIMSAEGMFGMIFSLLLGLESFRWRMLAGGLLVTLSVILVSLAPQEETEKS